MIIDTHAHIGKMLIFDMPEEDLLYSIEKYGIDFSLVSNIEGSEFDEHGKPVPDFLVKSQNTIFKETLAFVKEHSDKLGLLIWLRIFNELPDDEMVRLIEENCPWFLIREAVRRRCRFTSIMPPRLTRMLTS